MEPDARVSVFTERIVARTYLASDLCQYGFVVRGNHSSERVCGIAEIDCKDCNVLRLKFSIISKLIKVLTKFSSCKTTQFLI